MRYEVYINNSTQVMAVIDKTILDAIYDTAVRAKGELDMGMLYVLSKMGLLDDELRPTWR